MKKIILVTIISIFTMVIIGCTNQEMVKENENLKKQNQAMAQKYASLEKQKAEIEKAKVKSDEKISVLQKSNNELETDFNKVKALHNAAFVENKTLAESLAKIEEEKKALQETVDKLNKVYGDAVANLSSIKVQHGKIRKELEVAEDKTEALNVNMGELKRIHEELIKQIEDYKTDKATLMKQVASLNLERDVNLDNLTKLRDELTTLRNELESAINDKDVAYVKVSKAQYQNKNLVQDISSLNREILDLLDQFKVLREAYAKYVRMLKYTIHDKNSKNQNLSQK